MEKKMWFKVLHYGALWGIAEATLGYALHVLPIFDSLKIAGSIMFPIGVVLMYQAFKRTNKTQAILLTAVVAAAVKSVNFLMPVPNAVLNPMIAIIAEGLGVFLIMPAMLGKPTRLVTLCGMGFAVSAVWRVPFLYLPFQFGWKGMWQAPAERWIPFLTTDVFFSGLFIAAFLALAMRFPLSAKVNRWYEKLAFAPVGVFTALAAALALEYFIN